MTNFAERQYPQPGPTPPPVPAAWGKPRSKQVTWYDPARIAAGADGLSGLEFITALAEGRIAPAPIASLLNMRPVRAERGLVVFECVPDGSVYNPIGVVHGGLLCTLADSVAGCAVHTTLDRRHRLHVHRHHRQLHPAGHPGQRDADRDRPGDQAGTAGRPGHRRDH